MSYPDVAAAVRAATIGPLATDESVSCADTAVRLWDASAGVAYIADKHEIARRATAHVPPVTDPSVLDMLMSLPAGCEVRVEDLTDRERRLLQRVPQGVVDRNHDCVVRQLTPPLSVELVVVATRTWEKGLSTAGRFAPFCRRAMLLPAPPNDPDNAYMQAAFYGVGICVFRSGNLEFLVEPIPYVRRRPSSMHWWFAEQIYRQITARTATGATG